MSVRERAAGDIGLDGDGLDDLFHRALFRGVGVVIAGKVQHLPHTTQQLRLQSAAVLDRAARRDGSFAEVVADLACALGESETKFLMLKGPALWRALRVGAPLKIAADIDVLVVEEDTDRASAVLKSMGFRCRETKGSEACYVSEGRPWVDLHWSLLTVGNWAQRLGTFASGAWERRVRVDVEGTPVPTLSPTDTVLALALHAGCHHVCTEWIQIYEIALCAAVWRDQIDWDYLVHVSDAAGLKNALHCPLDLASKRFGAPIPEDIARRLVLPHSRRGIALIANAAFGGSIRTSSARHVTRTMYNLALQPGLASLVAWGRTWAIHQLSRRRQVDKMNDNSRLGSARDLRR